MSFLQEGYKEPVQSNYMSFEEGENTFRILGSAKVGWEYWIEKVIDGKTVNRPVRVGEFDNMPLADIVTNKFGNLNYSYFWAFPVYSFDNMKIQILVVKQKTIRRPMEKYISNKKWGEPSEYNFVVSRDKDESGKTVYTTSVEPKEPLDKSILDKFKAMKIDMDVWMKGEDPFMNIKDENEVSEDVKKKDEEVVTEEKIEDQIPF